MPSEHADIAVILLAAGKSSRMRGGDKARELVNGVPALRVMALRALEVSHHVIVTLPHLFHNRAELLRDLHVNRVGIAEMGQDMSASLKSGIAVVRNSAAMILPSDMPGITTEGLKQVMESHDAGGITRAASNDGTPGHPVIFDRAFFPQIAQLRDDEGAKSVIQNSSGSVNLVSDLCFDPLMDLDTPEEWTAWRESQTVR